MLVVVELGWVRELRQTIRGLLLLVATAGLPSVAYGQAVIAGSVTDQSGAILAGVTVAAASPALIERSRVSVTSDRGRYRIENLPPGVYTITFTRAGFRTYQHARVELSGALTATVDAWLEVGVIADAITVTRDLPAVDVHTVTRELALSGSLVRSLPTVRSYNALLVLVPGVVTNSNDVVTGTATTSFPIHGGRSNEGRLTLDGLNIGSPPNGNSAASYVVDAGAAEGISFANGSALGEYETAGLVMNIVPQSGGNRMRGSFFASGSGTWLQSDNVTPALRQQGLTAATPLARVYDLSGNVGGPIARDRVWFFANAHVGGSRKDSANVYYNLDAGDAHAWLYRPDLSRPAYSDRTFENASGRLTWQATARNKLTGFWDAQALCRTCTGATPGLSEPARVSPEAVGVLGRPLHVMQASWTSPLTSRVLLEAGFGGTYFGVGNFERSPNPTRGLIRVAEQCAAGCAANGGIPGLVYRSQDFSDAYAGSYLWKGSFSYVTGAHSVKAGYQHTLMTDDRTWMTNDQNLTYRVNNGVPNQLTQSISPWVNDTRVAWQGIYVQDQWMLPRLTLQGALRFDRAWSWFPAQTQGPARFLPEPIVIPETRGVDSYKDITVRMGAAFDPAGTGRSALKVSIAKYLEGAGVAGNYASTNPTLRLPQTTSVFGTAGVTRSWTDANRNFVPDCDLMNPAAQDLRASGGDACGVLSNTSFGRNVLTNNFDPAILEGWGVRPSDWNLAVTWQQQLGPRTAVDVTYSRRWYRGFAVADNLALQPSDLTPFSITAPRDPRLPGGGGYVVPGLYDVVPAKAGEVDNMIADSSGYGRWNQYFNGIDVTISMRSVRGLTVAGGTSTGQMVADNCEVRTNLPELSTATTGTSAFGPGLGASTVTPVSPYCHVAYGVLTQLRGFAAYLVPKVHVEVAAALQSKPGPMLAANYAAASGEAEPSLGRPLSGGAANVTVNLVAPGTMYGARINELDLRAGKTLTYRGLRSRIALDVFNALNSSAVLAYNNAFVPNGSWLQPLSILTPRLFKISLEVDF